MDVEPCIFRAAFHFTPTSNIVIPPFSTKVSKSIMFRLLGRMDSSKLLTQLETAIRYKKILLSPIFAGRRPLIKLNGWGSSVQTLLGGWTYSFYVTVLDNEWAVELVDALADLESTSLDIFNCRINLSSLEVRLIRMRDIGFPPDTEYLSFHTLTPVLLQLPPVVKTPIRHILIPIPSLIIGSLLDHWNHHSCGDLVIKDAGLPYTSFFLLREVDYRIFPVTVYYDEHRRPRGFIGRVLYYLVRTRRKKRRKNILRLLDYANYVGVGKSRTMGFGMVSIKPFKP
jgi:CRISPR-associated endoribonuclease Cas6